MIPKRFIAIIAYALPVLTVLYAVLSAGMLLLAPAESSPLLFNLRAVSGGVLALIATDVILLVGILGLNATVDETNTG